jgi:hypothetical protein
MDTVVSWISLEGLEVDSEITHAELLQYDYNEIRCVCLAHFNLFQFQGT